MTPDERDKLTNQMENAIIKRFGEGDNRRERRRIAKLARRLIRKGLKKAERERSS